MIALRRASLHVPDPACRFSFFRFGPRSFPLAAVHFTAASSSSSNHTPQGSHTSPHTPHHTLLIAVTTPLFPSSSAARYEARRTARLDPPLGFLLIVAASPADVSLCSDPYASAMSMSFQPGPGQVFLVNIQPAQQLSQTTHSTAARQRQQQQRQEPSSNERNERGWKRAKGSMLTPALDSVLARPRPVLLLSLLLAASCSQVWM